MRESLGPSLPTRLWRLLIGKPIPTSQAHHERLGPLIGLPVFSSDALSSVAYATEAILSVLILKSIASLQDQIWISAAIVGLIVVITISYTQTIFAYPQGGGSYIVASENLGTGPGMVAGAALMIDYILTVAVSIAAGVAAIVSAFPSLHPYLVPLSLFFIAVVAWLNLRGMRESGNLFAIPTYGFILSMVILLGFGIYRSITQGPITQQVDPDPIIGSEASYAMAFILLRSFAAGCTALTGIEAVSDGVQAFRAPESKNAAKTLRWMSFILATLFLGMGYVAMHLPVLSLHRTQNPEYRTLAYQVAVFAFGSPGHFMVYVVQFFTAAILILAANTAFADFPRLSSFIARDGFLPRALARQGDKLVFHNGIILLSVAACILVWYFHGELDQLLPLYAVGVFTAFTLSQSGMVMHWLKKREGRWRQSLIINSIGATLCFIVLWIVLITKFTEGAWLVTILLPAVCASFWWVKRRYNAMSAQLALQQPPPMELSKHIVLILVPRVHRGILTAVDYAQLLKGDIQAVHVTINEKAIPELRRNWEEFGEGLPLVILPSPYRSLIDPMLAYVDKLRADRPDLAVTVVVPEAVSPKWYQRVLHDNVAQQLKAALAKRQNVVVANVRYFLD